MSECILTTYATDAGGYGVIGIYKGSLHTTVQAHRKAWEDEHGPIPPGMKVLHRCDNPPCVNVDHLFLGTQADNIADMIAKGRAYFQKQTHCKHGHELNEENVRIVVRKNGSKQRQCKVCQRAYDAARYQSKKAMA